MCKDITILNIYNKPELETWHNYYYEIFYLVRHVFKKAGRNDRFTGGLE
jgi:hypothetical protein